MAFDSARRSSSRPLCACPPPPLSPSRCGDQRRDRTGRGSVLAGRQAHRASSPCENGNIEAESWQAPRCDADGVW